MTNQKMLDTLNEYMETMNATLIIKAKEQILEDIRAENAKKTGGAKRDKLIKAVEKPIIKNNPSAHGYHVVGSGDKFGFCDGYRAYVLNDNFGYEQAEKNLDIEKCKVTNTIGELTVDIADLKLYIADHKKKLAVKPYRVEKDDFTIGFNAQYLLEFLQMFETDTFKCSNATSPALIENDAGEWGILCPVRLKD